MEQRGWDAGGQSELRVLRKIIYKGWDKNICFPDIFFVHIFFKLNARIKLDLHFKLVSL